MCHLSPLVTLQPKQCQKSEDVSKFSVTSFPLLLCNFFNFFSLLSNQGDFLVFLRNKYQETVLPLLFAFSFHSEVAGLEPGRDVSSGVPGLRAPHAST